MGRIILHDLISSTHSREKNVFTDLNPSRLQQPVIVAWVCEDFACLAAVCVLIHLGVFSAHSVSRRAPTAVRGRQLKRIDLLAEHNTGEDDFDSSFIS